jgi:hypothetical protein
MLNNINHRSKAWLKIEIGFEIEKNKGKLA